MQCERQIKVMVHKLRIITEQWLCSKSHTSVGTLIVWGTNIDVLQLPQVTPLFLLLLLFLNHKNHCFESASTLHFHVPWLRVGTQVCHVNSRCMWTSPEREIFLLSPDLCDNQTLRHTRNNHIRPKLLLFSFYLYSLEQRGEIYKGAEEYRLRNLIKEKHKREHKNLWQLLSTRFALNLKLPDLHSSAES